MTHQEEIDEIVEHSGNVVAVMRRKIERLENEQMRTVGVLIWLVDKLGGKVEIPTGALVAMDLKSTLNTTTDFQNDLIMWTSKGEKTN